MNLESVGTNSQSSEDAPHDRQTTISSVPISILVEILCRQGRSQYVRLSMQAAWEVVSVLNRGHTGDLSRRSP